MRFMLVNTNILFFLNIKKKKYWEFFTFNQLPKVPTGN